MLLPVSRRKILAAEVDDKTRSNKENLVDNDLLPSESRLVEVRRQISADGKSAIVRLKRLKALRHKDNILLRRGLPV